MLLTDYHFADLKLDKFVVDYFDFDSGEQKENGNVEDKQEHLIVIECSGESEQAQLYDELQQREIKCKIM